MVDISDVIGILVFITILVIVILIILKNSRKILQKTVTFAKDVAAGVEIDPRYYEIAEQEIEQSNVDKGLWTKALVGVNGDEKLQKVEYIKLRAKQLHKSNR